jgi:hypothetical protein
MPHPRLRRLLAAACLPLLLAACGSEAPSAITPPEGISTVTAANGVSLTLTGGGAQAGAPGQPLAAPVAVRVTDRGGRPLANRQVIFTVTPGADADPRLACTDADGYARTTWTLGPQLGAQSLRATGTGGTLAVTANAHRGSGARIGLVKRLGDEQTAAAGALLGATVHALVVRDDGSLVPGAVVTFTAGSGGRVDRASVRAGGNGIAQVRWTLGPVGGVQTLTASTPGAAPVTYTATATGGAEQRKPPATLQVMPDSVVLDAGASATLTAVIRDQDGAQIPGNAPAWSSSTPGVATVDSVGTVRGVAAGTAQITARLGALSASATVRVRGGPASIQVLPDSLALDVGATARLTAAVRDAGGAPLPGHAPVWSTSDAAVATVDAQGEVRGVAAGTARVTATVGALSASATVRVRGGRFPSLEISPDSLVLDIGVRGRLFPVARNASGQAILGYDLEWSTLADQVVAVDGGGNLLPLGPGTARVVARWGTLADTTTVRVRPPRGELTIPQVQKRVASYGGYIDPSTRDVELNWWLHVSQRNVGSMSMRVRSPQGRTIDCANVDAESWFRNEFRCHLTLPRGSEPGTWRVDRVTVTKDGQTTVFDDEDLAAMGTLGRQFDVLGTGTDTQPPLVRMLWPHQGSRHPDRYYLEIGLVDHIAGVRSARITVRGPGGVAHSCQATQSYGALARVGGGVCLLPLRPGSGTWDVVSVEVEDGAGNRATYTPQQIAQASGRSEAPFLVFSFTP